LQKYFLIHVLQKNILLNFFCKKKHVYLFYIFLFFRFLVFSFYRFFRRLISCSPSFIHIFTYIFCLFVHSHFASFSIRLLQSGPNVHGLVAEVGFVVFLFKNNDDLLTRRSNFQRSTILVVGDAKGSVVILDVQCSRFGFGLARILSLKLVQGWSKFVTFFGIAKSEVGIIFV